LQVAAYVSESALYNQLQKYKRKIDACLLQKQPEVQDALRRPHHIAEKRLYLCTTNQEASATSSGSQTHILAK
jgi:hypothetical protein